MRGSRCGCGTARGAGSWAASRWTGSACCPTFLFAAACAFQAVTAAPKSAVGTCLSSTGFGTTFIAPSTLKLHRTTA